MAADISSLSEISEQGFKDGLTDITNIEFCDIPDYLNNSGNVGKPVVIGNKVYDKPDSIDYDRLINDILSIDSSNPDVSLFNTSTNTCEPVIIEFAADTEKYPHEQYTWSCNAGDAVYEEFELARCKQDNEMKPVKSIFSSGTVRTDASDGDFGRLFKTVLSRHIIIDGPVKSQNANTGGTSIKSLIEDPSAFYNLTNEIEESLEAFQILTSFMPYTLYLNVIYYKSKPKYKKNSLKYRRTEPEKSFSDFIKGWRDKEEKKFNSNIKKLSSVNSIKFTKGNADKLKNIVNSILKERSRYLNEMYNIYENWQERIENPVDIQKNNRHLYSFSDTMDFMLADSKELKIPAYDSSVMLYSEYFKNLSEYTQADESQPLLYEYRSKLKKFSKIHIDPDSSLYISDSSSYIEMLKYEVEDLDVFYKKCFEKFNDCDFTDVNDKNTGIISKLLGLFPDEAEWPEPDDITFDGITYKKYTFLNIDAINAERKSKGKNISEDEVNIDPDNLPTLENISLPDPDNLPIVDLSSALADLDKIDSSIANGISMINSNIEISMKDIEYWQKYLSIATMVTLPFLATGLIIMGKQIPLPCIYIPIKVINIKIFKLLLVIGIAVRGVSVNLMAIIVNQSSNYASYMLPLMAALEGIKTAYESRINSLQMTVPANIFDGVIKQLKANNTALIKQNKKFEVQMSELEAMQWPSKELVKRYYKKQLKQDLRQQALKLNKDIYDISTNFNNIFKNDVSSFKSLMD